MHRLGFAVHCAEQTAQAHVRSYAKLADKYIAENKLKLIKHLVGEENPNLASLDDDAAAPLLAKLEAQLAAIKAAVTNPLFLANDLFQFEWQIKSFKNYPSTHSFNRFTRDLEAYKVPVGNELIFAKAKSGSTLTIPEADTLTDEQLEAIWNRDGFKFFKVIAPNNDLSSHSLRNDGTGTRRIRNMAELEAARRDVAEAEQQQLVAA